jgi:hypothetical protein
LPADLFEVLEIHTVRSGGESDWRYRRKMPMIFQDEEEHTSGLAVTQPNIGTVGNGAYDEYRDGVMITVCHATALIYVNYDTTDPSAVRHDLKLDAANGPRTVFLDFRGPFKVLSSIAAVPLIIRNYRYRRSDGQA